MFNSVKLWFFACVKRLMSNKELNGPEQGRSPQVRLVGSKSKQKEKEGREDENKERRVSGRHRVRGKVRLKREREKP